LSEIQASTLRILANAQSQQKMRKELAFQSEEIFKFCQCYTKNKIARPKVGQQLTSVTVAQPFIFPNNL